MRSTLVLLAIIFLLTSCVKQYDDEQTPVNYTLPDSCNQIVSVSDNGRQFYFPTAFSPNLNDGRNDVYRAISNSFSSVGNYRLSVFRLNGELLFETTDLSKGWDGRDMNGDLIDEILFRVNIKGISSQTQATDLCTYVYSPVAGSNCVRILPPDAMTKAFFEDQFNPVTGEIPYNTGERFCP